MIVDCLLESSNEQGTSKPVRDITAEDCQSLYFLMDDLLYLYIFTMLNIPTIDLAIKMVLYQRIPGRQLQDKSWIQESWLL